MGIYNKIKIDETTLVIIFIIAIENVILSDSEES
jgi:hypothetical protein